MLTHLFKKKMEQFSQSAYATTDPADTKDPTATTTTPSSFKITTSMIVEMLLMIVTMLGITAFFGKFLWNSAGRKLIPALAECKSVWSIVGLHLLIILLLGM